MKSLLNPVVSAFVILALLCPSGFAAEYKIEEGTTVQLKLLQPLSSKTNQYGEVIRFAVNEDIMASDGKTILIKEGATATGTITNLEENGAFGKPGELALAINRTKAVNGAKVPLRASLQKEGNAKRGAAIGLGTVGALVFLPLALFFMKKGKNAEIPTGAVINAYVDSEVLVSIPDTPVTATGQTE